jgi:anti-anti-sigma factor
VLAVSGEVDLCTAPRLASELAVAQRLGGELIVDLEAVTFMDCVGVRVLLDAAFDAGADEPRFVVTPGPRQVRRLFEITGVDRLLRTRSGFKHRPGATNHRSLELRPA